MSVRRGSVFFSGRTARSVAVLLVVAAFLYYDCSWLPERYPAFTSMFQRLKQRAPRDELQVELEGASMAKMTLMMAVIDKAAVEEDGMLDLFLQSMRQGDGTQFLVKHLLLLATHPKAYRRCRALQLHCHRISSAAASVAGDVLERGYSFIFTELDVVWLRNPFARLNHNGEDLLVGRDLRSGDGGLCFVAANERTAALFKETRSSGSRQEGGVLNLVRSKRIAQQLQVGYLDSTYFSSFCLHKLDLTELAAVHANCCPSIRAKLADLKAFLDVWRSSTNLTSQMALTAHTYCSKSWKEYQLEAALRGAAMANRTLIVSYLNKAYVKENGMLDLFLRSLREGENTAFLVNHLFLITVDQAAFSRCKTLKLHCYHLLADERLSFSQEQVYMTQGYLNLVWQKISILRDVLKLGYSFIFTDIDIIWLRNPFTKLRLHAEDMQISCDNFNGRPFDDSNHINTGFFAVVSNGRTHKLFDEWLESRNALPSANDQDALVVLKAKGVFRRLGVRARFLDTLHFSGFCETSKSLEEVATVHANCCRTMVAKLEYLSETLETWKKFVGTAAASWPQSRACIKSWGL